MATEQRSDDVRGLPGEFPRPMRLTLLGAGSMFTPRLVNDLLRAPGRPRGTLALCDTDPERLETMAALIERLVAERGAEFRVEASAERRALLPGSDYLVNCIEVSGLACVRHDNDIPARYGIDQCIGDTVGPGGLFKGLRTIPVWLDVLRDAQDLCPQAWVLNYTNPMSMLCLAAARASSLQVLGLCHSVQATSRLLARRAGVRYRDLEWTCAGVNHLAWFTRLRAGGRNLYPALRRAAEQDLSGAGEVATDPDEPDLVRKDVMLHFGAFVTESSGHLSEYLPYYRKRADSRKAYCRDGYHGGSSFYADHWPEWRAAADRERRAMLRGEVAMDWPRSYEYASWIVEAREKDVPYAVHATVPNRLPDGELAIANLPADGVVEVECRIDAAGAHPTRFGPLPPQQAALCAAHMAMVERAATAALERSVDAAVHALLLDPLSAAVCTPAEIRALVLDLFEAEREYLPGYR